MIKLKRSGFTLIELLVVIAIIAIIAILIGLPISDPKNRTTCQARF